MLRLLLSALVAVLCFSVSVKADTVVVNSGALGFSGNWPFFTTYHFAGDGFAISSNAVSSNIPTPNFAPCICPPGATVNLGSRLSVGISDFITGGSVTVNGTQYFIFPSHSPPPPPSFITVSNDMTFVAGSVTIPFTNDPTITLTAPFTMTGEMVGRSGFVTVFSHSFIGSGIASVTFTRFDGLGPPDYRFQSISYQFQPVPEPATLLLLGTGLFALRFRRR